METDEVISFVPRGCRGHTRYKAQWLPWSQKDGDVDGVSSIEAFYGTDPTGERQKRSNIKMVTSLGESGMSVDSNHQQLEPALLIESIRDQRSSLLLVSLA